MANEPVNTPIQTKYAEQLAADLAANQAEQATLTERLTQLQREEKWLTAALDSMPPAGAEPASPQGLAEPVSATPQADSGVEAAAVPQPRAGKKTDGAAPVKKAAVRKTTAKKASAAPAKKTAPQKEVAAAKETAKAAEPTLGRLLASLLSQQPGEPKKVSEIRTELEGTHPERAKSDPVVRSALEKLAAKGVLEKSAQQGTVFYTWPMPEKAPAPAAAVTAQEPAEAVPAGA
ncbi:hypothetical protein [Streptomyces sp. NPDC059564]|uniref:hypothetical protein n=1 Tax=Streptomyces sp. NPDC059564 TaxID=3346865 RepID=UPI00368E8932